MDLEYGFQTSRFWWDGADFESCVPCPAWIYDGTHICTALRNFWITLTNRSQVFLRLLLLSFSTYNFALIFDITIKK
jgi:hypothetical protein